MLGMAVKFAGDAERADALLEDVARASAAAGNRRIEYLARVEQVWPRLARGALSVGEARSLLERALEIFAQADDFALGRAWQCSANVYGVYEFRFGELENLIARVHRHYERAGFASGTALHLLAVAAYRGRASVPAAIERCRTLLTQAETPLWESFLLPVLAALEAMQGRFDDARLHLEEARVRRKEFPGAGMLATNWASLAAEVELLASEPERAETILADACSALRAVGEVEWLATNGASLAEAQYRQGRWAEALSTSEAALSTGPPEHLTSKAIGRRVRAAALARVGRAVEAVAAAEEAIMYLEGTDVLNEHAETFAAAAEVHGLAGDLASAHTAWDQAIACFEKKGNVVSAARARNAAALLG
jgi:tetratricopeptide (TPR) repeat protein